MDLWFSQARGSTEVGPGWRLRRLAGAMLLMAFCLMAWAASSAFGVERVFWDNYRDSPATIGSSNLDGSQGAALNLSGAEVKSPEGMAYDSVTGRLYVASSGSGENGQIIWVNIDGSGAGVFSAPGAPVESPEGIAIDPATQKIYWVNTKGNGEAKGSLAWANVDGSVGGFVNTSGATLSEPYRLAIDPQGGRVYWTNYGPTPDVMSYANLNNSGGGGDLNVSGSESVSNGGLAVDSAAGRLYWLGEKRISFANVNGSGGGNIEVGGAVYESPYGLALDPSAGKFYWGNYGVHTGEPSGIGFEPTSGSGGGAISPSGVTVNGPQDPVIVKSPSGTGVPAITGASLPKSVLTCSQGSWAADYAGSFVYQAPRTYGYQWSLNGSAIAGATANTYTAAAVGSYTCSVTGTNPLGSTTQTSATFKVAALKLTVKPKKVNAKAGKKATFKATVSNPGSATVTGVRVCAKLSKKAKKGLKAGKCPAGASIAAGKKKTVKVSLKAKKGAEGTYGFSIQVPGKSFGAKAVKAKVSVKAPKKSNGKKGDTKH